MSTSIIRTFDILFQDENVMWFPLTGQVTTTFNADADAPMSPDPALTSSANHGAIALPTVNVPVGTLLRVMTIYQGACNYVEVKTE